MSRYWLVYYNGYCLYDVYSNNDEGGYYDNGKENENVNFAELVYCETRKAAINFMANKLEVSPLIFDAREMELHDLS